MIAWKVFTFKAHIFNKGIDTFEFKDPLPSMLKRSQWFLKT